MEFIVAYAMPLAGGPSWIIIRRADGEAVFEVFSQQLANAVRRDRYDVMSAQDYLGSLNRAIAWPNRE